MTNSQELFRRAASIYREAVLLRHVELSKQVIGVPKGYVKATCEEDLGSAKNKIKLHNYRMAEEYIDIFLDLVQDKLERM